MEPELHAKIAVVESKIDERSQHITKQLEDISNHLTEQNRKLDEYALSVTKNSLDIKWMKTLGSLSGSGIMAAISWIFYGTHK